MQKILWKKKEEPNTVATRTAMVVANTIPIMCILHAIEWRYLFLACMGNQQQQNKRVQNCFAALGKVNKIVQIIRFYKWKQALVEKGVIVIWINRRRYTWSFFPHGNMFSILYNVWIVQFTCEGALLISYCTRTLLEVTIKEEYNCNNQSRAQIKSPFYK